MQVTKIEQEKNVIKVDNNYSDVKGDKKEKPSMAELVRDELNKKYEK